MIATSVRGAPTNIISTIPHGRGHLREQSTKRFVDIYEWIRTMAAMNAPPLPTDAELVILNVLWAKGAATVREVHEAIDTGDTGYTTVLKTMQIMTAKG